MICIHSNNHFDINIVLAHHLIVQFNHTSNGNSKSESRMLSLGRIHLASQKAQFSLEVACALALSETLFSGVSAQVCG